jgi:hypothetical protein
VRWHPPRIEVRERAQRKPGGKASVERSENVSAAALETPPGPVDDPAHPPPGLRFETVLPPADSLESVADPDEPTR